MPWLAQTSAVLEAWYGGSKGADAVANLLFGDVNPSGKLPMTFPASENDLPRTTVAQPPAPKVNGVLSFKVDYNVEGAAVGYKWFESQKKTVLFPFGFGLSYTTFAYSGLTVSPDGNGVSFTLKNTGTRKGAEVAQVYAMLPDVADEPWKRLVGWQKGGTECWRDSRSEGEARAVGAFGLGRGQQEVCAAPGNISGDGRRKFGEYATREFFYCSVAKNRETIRKLV